MQGPPGGAFNALSPVRETGRLPEGQAQRTPFKDAVPSSAWSTDLRSGETVRRRPQGAAAVSS